MINTKTQKTVCPKMHKDVVWYATLMAKHLMTLYGKEFDLLIKTHGQSRSWGGQDYISIANSHRETAPHYIAKGHYWMNEYARIRKDPVIGEIKHCDYKTQIRGVVAHEVAHWFHHNLMKEQGGILWHRTSQYRSGYNAPHGKHWQEIYAILRKEFVNERTEITQISVAKPPQGFRKLRHKKAARLGLDPKTGLPLNN